MKRNFNKLAIVSLLLISTTAVADTQKIPKTYTPPKNDIYKDGWIDLNKNGKMDIYEDPTATIDARIEDLLSQMNLDEKTCQMVTLYGYKRVLADDLPTPEWKNKLWKDGMGAIDEHLNGFQQWGLPPSDNPYVWPASKHAWAINEVQRFFIEDTRLGIPVDFTNEGIRGVESYMATNFPTQLGLGHTWNRDLIHKVGYITGREAKLLGYSNVYAPILDVGRDQRWGRYEEIYGESPFLVAELGIQMVKGLQTNYQVASTAKHFIAYSNNKGAREGWARVDPQMSPREVENVHVYPWKRVISEAGVLGAMAAYNDYDGFPIESSRYWMMDRLRNEWGFKGYVVSDSDAVEYLYTKHRTAKDMKESVLQSVDAGLNVRCTFRTPDSYVLPLRELVEEGAISMSTIDNRVRDVLRVKFMVGLFDVPYQKDLKQADIEVNSEENQAFSLEATRQSLVLLKNEDNLLPLDEKKIKRVAVVGPNATAESFAVTHYGPLAVDVTNALEGIEARIGKTAEVVYTKGCELVDDHWPDSEIIEYPMTDAENKMIAEAVENAKLSDVVIAVMGGGTRTGGENKSRTSIELPGRQNKLLQALVATGKPVVMVLINGRPLSINWADRFVPSILEAWYPGSEGGTAIAEVIFGDYNPGGKLTVTVPKTVGQIPFNFPAKPASQVNGGSTIGLKGGQTRINGALYSFGYGLSYTTFEYSDIKLSKNVITPQQDIIVTCKIKNSGKRAGDEVVQMYVRDEISSVTTYEKVLRGFERVTLQPGETKEVSFALSAKSLELMNKDDKWVVEPGTFKIMIGASSEDIRLNDLLEVVDYGTKFTTEQKPEKIIGASAISSSDGSKSGVNVLDSSYSTFWKGNKGEYLTFALKDNANPYNIQIAWKEKSSDAKFEIQLSSGGGQFITVYSGDFISATNELRRYRFTQTTASDLRILITSGNASISEARVDDIKQ